MTTPTQPHPATPPSDSQRLDHLQRTGSTVEILPSQGAGGWRFRVGGLHAAVSSDIRAAIDLASGAQSPSAEGGGDAAQVAFQKVRKHAIRALGAWSAVGGSGVNEEKANTANAEEKQFWEALAALAAQPAAQQGVSAEGLRAQHDADSAELRRLCLARDHARRERDAARAEIAGLESSAGHLSAMVDGQTRLVQKAVAIMKALHESATPIDGPDMDACIPGHAFRVFVDSHAELMHALAVGPQITTPQPAQQGERWGWAIVDKHGVAQAIRPWIKDFFGAIQVQEPFTQEDVAKTDREWPGLAPHRVIALFQEAPKTV